MLSVVTGAIYYGNWTIGGILTDQNISGITIGKKEYKLSLFADDLLLYLSKVDISITRVIEIIGQFSKISGYKMNMSKTEIMAIDQKQTTPAQFKEFKVQCSKIKYLGCYIIANKKQLYENN